MKKAFIFHARKQTGMSMIGMLFVGIIVGCLLLVAAKTVPTVIEYQSIVKAVKKAARDGTNPAEIQRSFEAAATVDYFNAITPQDLEIEKIGDTQFRVSFAYDKEIVLMGPVSLLIHYKGSSQSDVQP